MVVLLELLWGRWVVSVNLAATHRMPRPWPTLIQCGGVGWSMGFQVIVCVCYPVSAAGGGCAAWV